MAVFCQSPADRPLQKNLSTPAWPSGMYRAGAATGHGANFQRAHASGASDKLPILCAVTATIRVAGIFTMPLFRCTSRQTR
jgi:hypothetical protein